MYAHWKCSGTAAVRQQKNTTNNDYTFSTRRRDVELIMLIAIVLTKTRILIVLQIYDQRYVVKVIYIYIYSIGSVLMKLQ